MFKWIVWDADRAKPINKRPLPQRRAGVLADIMETRLGHHMVLHPVQVTA